MTWSWVEKKEFLNQEIIIHNSIKGTRDKPEWTKILTRVYKSKTISRSNFSICYLQSRCVLCYLCVLGKKLAWQYLWFSNSLTVFRFHAWRWCITEQSAAYSVIVQSYRPLSSHSSQPRKGAADRVFLAANSLNTQMSSLDNWKSTVSCLAASLCRLVTLLRPPSPSAPRAPHCTQDSSRSLSRRLCPRHAASLRHGPSLPTFWTISGSARLRRHSTIWTVQLTSTGHTLLLKFQAWLTAYTSWYLTLISSIDLVWLNGFF